MMKDFTKHNNGKLKKSIWRKIVSCFVKEAVDHEAIHMMYGGMGIRKVKEDAKRAREKMLNYPDIRKTFYEKIKDLEEAEKIGVEHYTRETLKGVTE